jgi:hypothetical protein
MALLLLVGVAFYMIGIEFTARGHIAIERSLAIMGSSVFADDIAAAVVR